MVDKMTIQNDIRELIESEFSIDLSQVANNEDLLSSGVIDSQNFLEFMLIIEEKYRCKINPMETNLAELVTISGITAHVINSK